jgi:hypothetical protein
MNPNNLPNIENTPSPTPPPPPPPLKNLATSNIQAASQNFATAPPYGQNELNKLKNKEEDRQFNKAIKLSIENQDKIQNPISVNNQEKCKACTIL